MLPALTNVPEKALLEKPSTFGKVLKIFKTRSTKGTNELGYALSC